MAVRTKHSGRAMAMPAGIGIGTGVGVVLTLGMSAALAAMVLNGSAPESAVGYGSMAILLASSFAGALVSASTVKHRRLLVCGLTGAAYYIILLCCTALFFGGQYRAVGVTALMVLIGAAAAAVIGLIGENGSVRKSGKRAAW